MSEQTASELFSCDELWLLQSAIRHEMAQSEQWHFPPASLELNDQIAEALLLCEENGLSEAALILSRGDCLVVDYCVPQTAKSPSGAAIGKSVLLKSFHARRSIDNGQQAAESLEPPQLTPAEVQQQLRRLEGDK